MAAKKVGKKGQLRFAFEQKAARRKSVVKKKVTKKAGKKGKTKKTKAAKPKTARNGHDTPRLSVRSFFNGATMQAISAVPTAGSSLEPP